MISARTRRWIGPIFALSSVESTYETIDCAMAFSPFSPATLSFANPPSLSGIGAQDAACLPVRQGRRKQCLQFEILYLPVPGPNWRGPVSKRVNVLGVPLGAMSALGHKQTCARRRIDVRSPNTDIPPHARRCPLCAKSGHGRLCNYGACAGPICGARTGLAIP